MHKSHEAIWRRTMKKTVFAAAVKAPPFQYSKWKDWKRTSSVVWFFNKSTNKGSREIYGKCGALDFLYYFEKEGGGGLDQWERGRVVGCKKPMKIAPLQHFITCRCCRSPPIFPFHRFAPKLVALVDWVGVERESKQMAPMATVRCILGCPPSPSPPWNFDVSLISVLPHLPVPRSVQARF